MITFIFFSFMDIDNMSGKIAIFCEDITTATTGKHFAYSFSLLVGLTWTLLLLINNLKLAYLNST